MRCILFLCIMFFLSGCQVVSEGTGNAEPSGFLGDYSQLHDGGKGRVQSLYINESANWSSYDKIKIEPIESWFAKDSELNALTKEEVQVQLDYLHAKLLAETGKVFPLTERVDEQTMIIRIALTDAQRSAPVRDLISNVVPFGLAFSIGRKVITGRHSAVGSAMIEAEIIDFKGRRLFAALDERSGKKVLKGKFDRWSDVHGSFDHWVARLVAGLERIKNENNLVKESRGPSRI